MSDQNFLNDSAGNMPQHGLPGSLFLTPADSTQAERIEAAATRIEDAADRIETAVERSSLLGMINAMPGDERLYLLDLLRGAK